MREVARTKCGKCGAPVDRDLSNCPNCGALLRRSPSTREGRLTSALLTLKPDLWLRALAMALALVSLVVAWGGASLIDSTTGFTSISRSFSAIDLLASGNVVAIGALLFLIGSFTSLMEARLVILNAIGLVVTAFTITPYMTSVFDPSGPPAGTFVSTFFGLGYFVAWLSVLLYIAAAFPAKDELKGLPASETHGNEYWGMFRWLPRR